jgi:hypothetical protein
MCTSPSALVERTPLTPLEALLVVGTSGDAFIVTKTSTTTSCVILLIFIITGVPKGQQMRPSLIEQPLQIDPCLIDRCTRRIEYEVVSDHDFEVFEEFSGIRALSGVELLPHCRHVHRLSDSVIICQDIKLNRICAFTYIRFERTAQ